MRSIDIIFEVFWSSNWRWRRKQSRDDNDSEKTQNFADIVQNDPKTVTTAWKSLKNVPRIIRFRIGALLGNVLKFSIVFEILVCNVFLPRFDLEHFGLERSGRSGGFISTYSGTYQSPWCRVMSKNPKNEFAKQKTNRFSAAFASGWRISEYWTWNSDSTWNFLPRTRFSGLESKI